MNKGKNKKTKYPKYEFGAYVENPYTTLTENQIAIAAAQNKSKTNPFAIGTKVLGNMALQYGSSMMSKGRSQGEGVSPNGLDWGNLLQQGISGLGILGNAQNSFAMGGKVNMLTPINAEGDEVIETPDGMVGILDGPTHANGGIDLAVPGGTEIFSRILTGPDGKTMADRKIKREKNTSKIQKLSDSNPTDSLLKRTLKRTQESNEKVESVDLAKMQFAKMLKDMSSYMTGGTIPIPYATGGYVDPLNPDPDYVPDLGSYVNNNPYFPTDTLSVLEDTLPTYDIGTSRSPSNITPGTDMSWLNGILGRGDGGATFGDLVGLGGNLISTFGPLNNTRRQRATDTPNINPYLNFGKDGLNKLDQSKSFLMGNRDEQLGDLELIRNSAIRRGRNSARGVNTQRALDLASELGVNEQRSNINNQYLQALLGVYAQEAGLLNTRDQMVMTGEGQRDANDRADKDAYFSALGKDIGNVGTGLQMFGKNLNQIKQRTVQGRVLNNLFPNFNIDTLSGDVKAQANQEVARNQDKYSSIPDTQVREMVYKNILNKTWSWKGDKVIDSATGKEIDLTTGNIIQ